MWMGKDEKVFKEYRSLLREQMWNVRGLQLRRTAALWSLFHLLMPADHNHDPCNQSLQFYLLFSLFFLLFLCSIKLHRSGITTESNSSLYCSQQCNMSEWQCALLDKYTDDRTITVACGEECLAVCREWRVLNSAAAIRMALQFDVLLLQSKQQRD